MKRYLQHILILLAAIMILVPSCKREGPRVIPRSKLAKIYAEMFVMDQWIQLKPGLRTIADTSLVYEPILEKYGYDSDDYQYSVDRYMDDPERFSRILRSTVEILDKEIKSLKKQQAELKLHDKEIKSLKKQQAELKLHEEKKKEVARYEITMFQFYDELISADGLRDWSDSLDVAWDTVYNAYRFRRIHRTDTIYEGPRMIVSDTLSVTDTLVSDSLAVSDSLIDVDSLKQPAIRPIKGTTGLHTPTTFPEIKTPVSLDSAKAAIKRRSATPVRKRQ